MNTRKLFILLVTAAFVIPSMALGQGQDRIDPIKHLLFPPDLIMKHRSKLDLNDEQQDILKSEMQLAQSTVFDFRWEMNDESEKMAQLIKTTPIDESELLAQADKVMALEHQIKRIHLTLLIRLKNMLSPQQIETLRRLRRDSFAKARSTNSK